MSILVGGFGQRSSFPGWLVINCFLFFVFFFFGGGFLFPFFWNLEWNATPTSGWEQRTPPFLLKLKSLLCRQGSLFVKSQPSSLASSPRLRKIRGLAVPPSTPFFGATGILWFDWPINLSSFKMKGWLLPF